MVRTHGSEWNIRARISWSSFMEVVRMFPDFVDANKLCEADAEAFEWAAAEIRRKLKELEGTE